MAYQTAALPRPVSSGRPHAPVVPRERVRPPPPPPGAVERLQQRLARLERALTSAAREASRWKARARALQGGFLPPIGADAPAIEFGPLTETGGAIHPDLVACMAIVCAISGEAPVGLVGRSRRRGVVKARHVVFWLARCSTGLSLAEIGRPFCRDHATVLHGIRRCDEIALALGVDGRAHRLREAARMLLEADWREIGSL